jgi:hypothetical protein
MPAEPRSRFGLMIQSPAEPIITAPSTQRQRAARLLRPFAAASSFPGPISDQVQHPRHASVLKNLVNSLTHPREE